MIRLIRIHKSRKEESKDDLFKQVESMTSREVRSGATE